MYRIQMRIGIVDYHGDFTSILKSIIPDHHTVIVYGMKETINVDDIDMLLNHHQSVFNNKYAIPFIVVPYGSFTQSEVDEWNANKWCKGVLDMSSCILDRFPSLTKPVWRYIHYYDLPLYTEAGTKTICLINHYETRFKSEYDFTSTVTPHIYGAPNMVNDVKALEDAKWLINIKPQGFVCNSVVKALACGVPVIMDDLTWKSAFWEKIVKHGHNGIVLPRKKIKAYLKTSADYDSIKKNCVEESSMYKKITKWTDGWWL
jgi:hypothetical protein